MAPASSVFLDSQGSISCAGMEPSGGSGRAVRQAGKDV